jgi:hypothetical protein
MTKKHLFLGILMSFFLVSCASAPPKDKDAAVDEALGTGAIDDEAEEVQEALQDAQLQRRKEQQQLLERQITDPDLQ